MSVFNLTTLIITKHNAILAWRIENIDKHYPEYYNVSIIHRSECDMTWKYLDINENIVRNGNDNQFLYAFDILCPNKLNRITLSTNSTLNNVTIPSFNVTFTGVPREPFFSPDIDPGSFFIDDIGNLHLYWKKIEEVNYNGDNYMIRITNEYKIQTNHSNQTSNPKVDIIKSFVTFEKDQFNATLGAKFKLLSTNDVGPAKEASFIEIPSIDRRCGKPENIQVVKLGNDYNVTWKKPIGDYNITSYTVFWCSYSKDSPAQCDSPIDYERVNETLQILTLSNSDQHLKFAVSANTESSTSGMIWEQCKAVTDTTLIGQVESFRNSNTSTNKIELNWAPKCNDSLIVMNYSVEYCPVKDMTSDCTQTTKFLITNFKTLSIDNLKSNTLYRVTVIMQSATTKGPPSYQYIQTLSSG